MLSSFFRPVLSTMDADKHENDDEFTMVLELPETDPLFEKKKKLLEDMGFDPEGLFCIKRSSTLDQLKDFLDVLVKRARIVNFNEVELYFGGDIINSGDSYSPRNELKALHSILKIIDKSSSGEKYTMKNIQQKLQEEIVDRIGRVGKRFSKETKILGDFRCGKEKELLDWGVSNGMKTKLDIAWLSFGVGAFMALDGTLLLEEIVQATEHLRTQYDELFPTLSDRNPDVFPPELYTWEQFLWACELWYSNSMKVIFRDGQLRTCLIPVAGFLNHSICPHIMHYGRIDATTNSLKFPLSRPCNSGEQCFLSYGNFSNSHLLTFYGFLPRDENPYNVIPLDIDVARDEDSEVVSTPSEWSSHMVRGTWLSKNHGIFNYGLPPSLLNYLRGARNLMHPSKTHTREDMETDIDVLRYLSSTFEGMMEALGDENPEDMESTSWDVKLAIEFKNSQGRIISSILTSCNAGCELLRSELRKYTV